MNLKFDQTGSRAIVYDADCIQQPELKLFEEGYWRQQSAVSQTAIGRGNVLMLDTPFGPWVLRSYLRGGWAASVSRDRYLFTGYQRSRAVLEVRMLAAMSDLGLPVPTPIAGVCLRHGLSYSGALLTGRIPTGVPLADQLTTAAMKDTDWLNIGQCIRRFHDAGVVHPDLNARNILLTEQENVEQRVYLIDFDRAFFRAGAKRLFLANLDRLHRSLKKLWPQTRSNELEPCWQQLSRGYMSQSSKVQR